MSDDLVTWLREQIEARKRTASVRVLEPDGPWRLDGGAWDAGTGIISDSGRSVAVAIGDYAARHIVASDPRDTIARCEAELAILDEHYILWSEDRSEAWEEFSVYPAAGSGMNFGCVTCHYYSQGAVKGYGYCRTVRLLASGYQYRPGYQEGWKPQASEAV